MMRQSNSLVVRALRKVIPSGRSIPVNGDLLARARELNERLHSDVRSIPEATIDAFTQTITDLCAKREYSEEYTEAWIPHRYRLYLTLEWLKTVVEGPAVGIETGGSSIVTDLLHERFPRARWHNTENDLRDRWEFSDDFADVIVSTEVLEHLSDPPEGVQDSFQRTGLLAMLKECYRVIKPGGCLFATTPNAASVWHLESVLDGTPPWYYHLHVREYTIPELSGILGDVGFTVERCQALHCLPVDENRAAVDHTRAFSILLEHGFDTDNRGDDIFLVARKPVEA
jgi:predicted SAM-dependent methyltransferase